MSTPEYTYPTEYNLERIKLDGIDVEGSICIP